MTTCGATKNHNTDAESAILSFDNNRFMGIDQVNTGVADMQQKTKAKRLLNEYCSDERVSKKPRNLSIAGKDALISVSSTFEATHLPTVPEIINQQKATKSRRLVTEAMRGLESQNAAGFTAAMRPTVQQFHVQGSDWAVQLLDKAADQATFVSDAKIEQSVETAPSDLLKLAYVGTSDYPLGPDTPSTSSEATEDYIHTTTGDEPQPSERQPKPSLIPTTTEELCSENLALRNELVRLSNLLYPPEVPPRSRTIHRVVCDCDMPIQATYYDDCPAYAGIGNSGHIAGRSTSGVRTNGGILQGCGSNVVLVILKNYRCNASKSQILAESSLPPAPAEISSSPCQQSESMAIIGEDVRDMFQAVMSEAGISNCPVNVLHDKEIRAPYVFFHHNRDSLKASAALDRFRSHKSIQIIMEYLETFQGEFENAKALAKENVVSLKTIRYLFKAGQIIVKGPLNSESLAFYTDSYLENEPNTKLFRIKAWCWRYDGKFWRDKRTICIDFPRSRDTMSLSNLEFQPLEFTPQNFQNELRRRGSMFWKCRQRKYVRYESQNSYEVTMNDTRYMIDYDVWCSQQPNQSRSLQASISDATDTEYLAPDLANSTEPPPGAFLFLLPSQIPGFHMLNKRWEPLNVSGISDVEWNKRAFESLVVDPDAKELIQALVTQQLPLEKSTDLIEGKGNSLVILLHGGPGTGKTLTAESVAELAEKPLYRVTCGDIGTDPVSVERHLRGVLYLGKAWGCVVLLDEADVFLEERRSHDLSRNALVSCFLRALEYYDGILILTTNRVGTFDEAFKSRIQLSLRYDNLTEKQRLRIWENFFQRLEDIDEERVDVSDLRHHSRDLAKHKMNGRQIRNSLTNARQLAAYKKERMNMTHVKRAIDAFTKFEAYTKDINQGITDDDLARECRIR